MHAGEAGASAAEWRLSLLVQASAHLAGSLDLRAVGRGLADALVPQLAEQVEVDLVEGIVHADLSPGNGTETLLRVARAGGPVDLPTGAGPDRVAYPPGSAGAAVIRSGRVRVDRDPDGSTALLVPIRARGLVLGVVRLVRTEFEPADVALAEEIAARAALALDNIRLYDEARAASVALQRSLLPASRPRITGVETADRYLPSNRDLGVGGDWFDVIPLSCGRVAFVIGDVMGRGLRAAAAMGQLRTAVRMLAVLDHLPEDVLSGLDDLALETDQVQLATCAYAVFDPVARTLSFATAGHPPPVLRGVDGATVLLPQPSGAPLGVGGVAFESCTVEVEDGSRLLLFTDGLVESRHEDLDQGLGHLAEVFGAQDGTLEQACEAVLLATGRARGHHDDVALLAAELHGLADERVATWSLGGGPESVSSARAWVRQQLGRWELQATVDLAELAVSELVTNALRHAREPVEVSALLLDDVVTLAVADGESPLPRLRRSSPSDEGGRGLQLVSSVASRWGARPTADGKVVWCDLPLPRP